MLVLAAAHTSEFSMPHYKDDYFTASIEGCNSDLKSSFIVLLQLTMAL